MDHNNKIEELQKKTSFSEDVCGCFVSNYQKMNICPPSTGGWCKELTKCRMLEQIEKEKIKNENH